MLVQVLEFFKFLVLEEDFIPMWVSQYNIR